MDGSAVVNREVATAGEGEGIGAIFAAIIVDGSVGGQRKGDVGVGTFYAVLYDGNV